MPWVKSKACKRGHPWTPENTYTPPIKPGRKYSGRTCRTCRAIIRRTATVADTKWFNDYKKTLKCERCPESHPACLDFHHRDPKTKLFKVGGAAPSGMPKEKVMAEIAKCMVLCANCHRKEHN